MTDLWLELFQVRNGNYKKNHEIEKIVENNITCEGLPEFLQPQAVLSVFQYEKLEKLMADYERHFQRKIDIMEIELELEGWEVLLEYCVKNNRPLEKISNRDIYKIKHAMDGCLEDGEEYYVPVKYQRGRLSRTVICAYKRCIRR